MEQSNMMQGAGFRGAKTVNHGFIGLVYLFGVLFYLKVPGPVCIFFLSTRGGLDRTAFGSDVSPLTDPTSDLRVSLVP